MKYDGYIEVDGMTAKKFLFVSEALDEKGWREFEKYILCEEEESGYRLTGTDGKRIHTVALSKSVFDVFGICPGLYLPVKKSKKSFGAARISDDDKKAIEYPDIKIVLPTGSLEKEIIYYPPGDDRAILKNFDSIRCMPERLYINPAYLPKSTVSDVWTCKIYGKKKSVEFVAGDAAMYVLPMWDFSMEVDE